MRSVAELSCLWILTDVSASKIVKKNKKIHTHTLVMHHFVPYFPSLPNHKAALL